ncbi:2'-5' RNA ligase family protein [Acidisphaera sp. L21]|uniref:2'-5' RNA ligase family protein n=1 Tax=Acidisphaera sp. L21 TaxID=1641851 RepID=UPI00131AA05A|nr:2'-5' RNA ligase family protein [Acidisphaera sp. L21]
MTPGGALPSLILTALLDPVSQDRFQVARQHLFPPERNQVPAHVTLFHQLPGAEEASISRLVATVCEGRAPCPFATTRLRFLGFGTAYLLDMSAVSDIREHLAAAWEPWLTPQDRRVWSPHITVQNKAAPDEAKRVFAKLQATFQVERGAVIGLALWRYLGGPWDLLVRCLFTATEC